MVLYPFVMCAFVWFVSRVRAKDRKKVCALIMILASAVELAAAVNLVLCDLRGGVVGVCELPAVGGLGLHFMFSRDLRRADSVRVVRDGTVLV